MKPPETTGNPANGETKGRRDPLSRLLAESLSEDGPECRDLEELIGSGESTAIATHVETCVRCRHEIETFIAATGDDASLSPAAIGEITDSLSAHPRWKEASAAGQAEVQPSGEDAAENVAPWPPLDHRSRRSVPVAPLAAAASLLLVAVLGWWQLRGSEEVLPEPQDTLMRSAVVEPSAPLGRSNERPTELAWMATEGAAGYRASLRNVRGDVLFECEVTAAEQSCRLTTSEVVQSLVRYSWRVVAIDGAGETVAASRWTDFVWEPVEP